MIGFPLQLPIEASTRRNLYLVETSATVSAEGAPMLAHDHFHQLRIDLTDAEATAIRAWLQKVHQP